MHMIWHKGQSYMISDAANDALSDMGDLVASGQITEDEATAVVLRAEGFAV